MVQHHQHSTGLSNGTEGNWGWMPGGGGNRKRKRWKKEVCLEKAGLFSVFFAASLSSVRAGPLVLGHCKTHRLKGKPSNPALL